jgi:hypothetical protein
VSSVDPSRASSPADEDLASLLAKERRAHPTSSAAKARVWSRLERSIDMSPRDPNGGGGASAPATSPPRLGFRPTKLMAQLSMAACLLGASTLLWSAVTKTDAAAPRVVASPDALPQRAPRAAESQRTSSAEPSPLETPASISVGALPSVSEVSSPPRAPRERSRRSADDSEGPCTICEERSILDVARRGLREKHHDVALAAIEEHRARFAAGQLAEERESLRVHVLVAMGRNSDAELGKAEFRRAFPDSPLRESVERAGAR